MEIHLEANINADVVKFFANHPDVVGFFFFGGGVPLYESGHLKS